MKNISKLKVFGLAALLLSPLGAYAAVDGKAEGGEYTTGYAFDLGFAAGDCAADFSDCGQLMVNASGGTVKMALILPTSLKDNTYGANADPAGYQDFRELTGSDSLDIQLGSQLLAMDFLEGITDKHNGPVFTSGFTGNEGSDASAPSWAIAAATSMEYNYLASSPDGLTAPTHFGDGADSPGAGDPAEAFWVNEHIYEWEVDESIFAGGTFDISQVSIAEIHLSPKKEDYNKTPPLVDCPPGNDDCLPPDTCDPGDPSCNPCDPSDPSCNPTDVPLPGTLVLMLMGLGILSGRRVAVRRSRHKATVAQAG